MCVCVRLSSKCWSCKLIAICLPLIICLILYTIFCLGTVSSLNIKFYEDFFYVIVGTILDVQVIAAGVMHICKSFHWRSNLRWTIAAGNTCRLCVSSIPNESKEDKKSSSNFLYIYICSTWDNEVFNATGLSLFPCNVLLMIDFNSLKICIDVYYEL